MALTGNNKNKNKTNSPSEVISNELLNGDTSAPGVGLPLSSNNISTNIVESAATISDVDPLVITNQSSSSKTSKQTTRVRASSPLRRLSPIKNRSPTKFMFLDSDSDTDEIGGSALKMHYSGLNSVEHSSFLNYYRMN